MKKLVTGLLALSLFLAEKPPAKKYTNRPPTIAPIKADKKGGIP